MQNSTEPQFEVLHMAPENTNSVLVTAGNECVIFDAWGHVDAWKKLLTERGLTLRAIYSTHGHSDHISAAPALATEYNVPWFLNHRDNELIMWGNPILDYFGIPQIQSGFKQPSDISAGHKNILPCIDMDIIETAGHSAGGVSYYFPDFGILLTGDTLFRDGVGRCDFPTGDAQQLRISVGKLYDMGFAPDTYVVHGHGLDSTIGGLVAHNPYFKSADCECGHGCHNHNGAEHCCCGHCHHND